MSYASDLAKLRNKYGRIATRRLKMISDDLNFGKQLIDLNDAEFASWLYDMEHEKYKFVHGKGKAYEEQLVERKKKREHKKKAKQKAKQNQNNDPVPNVNFKGRNRGQR